MEITPGRPYRRRTIERLTAKWGERAGVAGRCTPHRLRHSFATQLFQRGTDIRIVQALLGHADIKSTTIYTQVGDAQLFGDILKLPTRTK